MKEFFRTQSVLKEKSQAWGGMDQGFNFCELTQFTMEGE